MSPVTCHLSPVTCHLSPITCYLITTLCSYTFYESLRWLGDAAAGALVIDRVKNMFVFPTKKINCYFLDIGMTSLTRSFHSSPIKSYI